MSTTRHENITTKEDYEELRKAYQFLPDDDGPSENDGRSSSWQERMVEHYHSHLYRSHVMADLTLCEAGKIGLRWRTKKEVMEGKGFDTCGNKHCPSYYHPPHRREEEGRPDEKTTRRRRKSIEEVIRLSKSVEHRSSLRKYYLSSSSSPTPSTGESTLRSQEMKRLNSLPYGLGPCDYEVHFAYIERGKNKEELVKLRLCLRCAPMLYFGKGGVLKAKSARDGGIGDDGIKEEVAVDVKKENEEILNENDEKGGNSNSSSSSSSTSTSSHERRRRRRKKRRRKRSRHEKSKRKRKKRRLKSDEDEDDGDSTTGDSEEVGRKGRMREDVGSDDRPSASTRSIDGSSRPSMVKEEGGDRDRDRDRDRRRRKWLETKDRMENETLGRKANSTSDGGTECDRIRVKEDDDMDQTNDVRWMIDRNPIV